MGHGPQRLVLHLDQRGGLLGGVPGLGGDGRDGLAVVGGLPTASTGRSRSCGPKRGIGEGEVVGAS